MSLNHMFTAISPGFSADVLKFLILYQLNNLRLLGTELQSNKERPPVTIFIYPCMVMCVDILRTQKDSDHAIV